MRQALKDRVLKSWGARDANLVRTLAELLAKHPRQSAEFYAERVGLPTDLVEATLDRMERDGDVACSRPQPAPPHCAGPKCWMTDAECFCRCEGCSEEDEDAG